MSCTFSYVVCVMKLAACTGDAALSSWEGATVTEGVRVLFAECHTKPWHS